MYFFITPYVKNPIGYDVFNVLNIPDIFHFENARDFPQKNVYRKGPLVQASF